VGKEEMGLVRSSLGLDCLLGCRSNIKAILFYRSWKGRGLFCPFFLLHLWSLARKAMKMHIVTLLRIFYFMSFHSWLPLMLKQG